MKRSEFDKYYYYSESVQSPAEDVLFLETVYREMRALGPRPARRQAPKVFREDFCGTFANCCAWVMRDSGRIAHGIDLDPEPLNYGKTNYLPRLTPAQQRRLHVHKKNVLTSGVPPVDLICAMNFSYYIFKERQALKKYFAASFRGLKKGGVFVLDSFGGPKCGEPNEEVAQHGEPPFSYYWDQDSFDPLTNEAKFYIHFKRRGEKKRTRVFTYDWRLWAPAEVRDLLHEVGFKHVEFYWEGATPEGAGDGEFKRAQHGEDCEAWVAYIAARK